MKSPFEEILCAAKHAMAEGGLHECPFADGGGFTNEDHDVVFKPSIVEELIFRRHAYLVEKTEDDSARRRVRLTQ